MPSPRSQRVLTIDPSDVGAAVNLGQLYLQQRDTRRRSSVLRERSPPNRTT